MSGNEGDLPASIVLDWIIGGQLPLEDRIRSVSLLPENPPEEMCVPLLELVTDKRTPKGLRVRTLEYLYKTRHTVSQPDALISLMTDADEPDSLRFLAAILVSRLSDENVLKAFESVLSGPSGGPILKLLAVEHLDSSDSEFALDALCRCYVNSSLPEQIRKHTAASFLKENRRSKAETALIRVASNREDSISMRELSIGYLGESQSSQSLAVLLRVASDSEDNRKTRLAAIEAAVRAGGSEVLPDLLSIAHKEADTKIVVAIINATAAAHEIIVNAGIITLFLELFMVFKALRIVLKAALPDEKRKQCLTLK